MSTIDPDDLESLAASPGDFTTTDSAGDTQQMETFGTFLVDKPNTQP